MEDAQSVRMAYLGKDESDKNIDNKRAITIHISSGIPFVMVDDRIVNDYTVNATTVDAKASDTDIINTLVDPDMDDRYTYICETKSSITKNIVRLYYDAKYEDIIVVPDTTMLGTSDLSDPNSNQQFDLIGYVIGGGDVVKDGIWPGTVNPKPTFKLPTTNKNLTSTHMGVLLNGVAPTMGGRKGVYYVDDAGTYRLADNRRLPVGLLDLGNIADIFGQDVTVPVYTVYQGTTDMYKVKYLGFKSVTKAYILLDF